MTSLVETDILGGDADGYCEGVRDGAAVCCHGNRIATDRSLVLRSTWSVEVLRPPGLHQEVAIDTHLYHDDRHLIRYAINLSFMREIVLTEAGLP